MSDEKEMSEEEKIKVFNKDMNYLMDKLTKFVLESEGNISSPEHLLPALSICLGRVAAATERDLDGVLGAVCKSITLEYALCAEMHEQEENSSEVIH